MTNAPDHSRLDHSRPDHSRPDHGRPDLTRYAWLSIAAAVTTIALKSGAYWLTGSVGLLADAAESIVNLVAAVVALMALRVAARPADDDHPFGHSKAEYFAAVVEGVMIFVAAVFILISAVRRFISPQDIENVGIGLAVSVIASVINGVVAWKLISVGREHRSITLAADGKHLLTDVWTSVGVVVAVLLVALTGWLRLDPIIAFVVGLNIIWAGWHLISESVSGLMDHAFPADDAATVVETLEQFATEQVHFHGIRTREAGHQRFISMHMLVPGDWTVHQGHDLAEQVEAALRERFGAVDIDVHMEPEDDPRSFEQDSVGLVVPPRPTTGEPPGT